MVMDEQMFDLLIEIKDTSELMLDWPIPHCCTIMWK